MITYNIDVYIGRNAPERKTVVKCHDTGVCLSCLLMTEERTSKWRTTPKFYTPPVDSTSVIKIKKPDGKYVLQDGTRKGSSTLFFELPSQAFTAAGIAEAEINIFDVDGRRLTTETFFIDVPQEVANDCTEDSETYVSVMAQQIQAAIDAAERAENAANSAEEGAGRTAYEIAVKYGFEGTEEEWLESLKGAPGETYELTDEDKKEIAEKVEEGAIGDIETALNKILAIQESLLSEIFTILDTTNDVTHTLRVEPDMTWGEWVESDYNTIGVVFNEYDEACVNGRNIFISGDNFTQPKTEIIVLDAEYWF